MIVITKLSSIQLLQQRFYAHQMEESDSMATYFSKVEGIAYQLKQMGENISESMTITKILMSLPQTL